MARLRATSRATRRRRSSSTRSHPIVRGTAILRAALLAIAIVSAACLPPSAQRLEQPVGRLYPNRYVVGVVIHGADGRDVWRRLRRALEAHGVPVATATFETYAVDGFLEDMLVGRLRTNPFAVTLEADVNDHDYAPPELVIAPGRSLNVRQDLSFTLDAHPNGDVRLVGRITGTVEGYYRAVRLPSIAVERVLRDVVQGIDRPMRWMLEN